MSMSSKTTPFILEVFFCQIQLAGPIEEHIKMFIQKYGQRYPSP